MNLVKVRGLYIVGAGAHGRVVAAAAAAAGYHVAGFLDDTRPGEVVMGIPVLGPVSRLDDLGDAMAVLAVGDNAARAGLAQRYPGIAWETVIHPTAWVHESVTIGPGAMIMARAVVQPGAVIGAHAIINTAAAVEHDCRIGDAAHLATGVMLGGHVVVGAQALLGTGAAVRPRAVIGEGATVGAGAVVIADIPPAVVAIGCPARPVDSRR